MKTKTNLIKKLVAASNYQNAYNTLHVPADSSLPFAGLSVPPYSCTEEELQTALNEGAHIC